MNIQSVIKLIAATSWLLVVASFSAVAAVDETNAKDRAEFTNTALVQKAFDDWANGRGSVFDLLAEDAVWTVAGSSPVSGVYHTRQELIEGAVEPIHNRLATSIRSEVKQIIAQGNQVVVLWDGYAQTYEGSQYVNSYAWHLVFADGKITEVTAFLDTWALNELME